MARRGVDIPPELFANIICYIGTEAGGYADKRWECGEKQPREMGPPSLVCVYWAQRCRLYLYEDSTVTIHSAKQAVRFRNLVMGSCSKRFTPIVDMIKGLEVKYDIPSEDKHAWHPILGALVPLVPADKFLRFWLLGSEDARSPHWAIATSLPSFSNPYRELRLSYCHVPSLRALLILLRKFPRVQVLWLSDVTWDEDHAHALTRPRPADRRKRRDPSLSRIELFNCQHGARILHYLVHGGLNGGSLLRTLSDEDQRVMVEIHNRVYAICSEGKANIFYDQTTLGQCTFRGITTPVTDA